MRHWYVVFSVPAFLFASIGTFLIFEPLAARAGCPTWLSRPLLAAWMLVGARLVIAAAKLYGLRATAWIAANEDADRRATVIAMRRVVAIGAPLALWGAIIGALVWVAPIVEDATVDPHSLPRLERAAE